MKKHKNSITTDNKNEEISRLPQVQEVNTDIENISEYKDLVRVPRIHLRLNSIENTRRSQAAIVRAVARGDLSHSEGRSYTYMMMGLCQAFKTSQDLNLTRQIEELKMLVLQAENDGRI